MTKKDYILIAQALYESKPAYYYSVGFETWELSVQKMAKALRSTNPRFNEDRFIRWCHSGK